MLKIDCLDLADNDFNVVELGHLEGDAVVKVSGTPVAAGKFRMANGGMCTMCAIDAAGRSLDNSDEPKAIELNKPEDLTVALSGTLKRSFPVPAGVTSVDTRCKAATAVRFAGQSLGAPDANGKVTLPAAVDKDREVELEIDVAVATGAAHDSNANHKLEIVPDNKEGLLHFAILCNVGKATDHKPNKTHFEVRGARPWKVMGKDQPVEFKHPAAAAE